MFKFVLILGTIFAVPGCLVIYKPPIPLGVKGLELLTETTEEFFSR